MKKIIAVIAGITLLVFSCNSPKDSDEYKRLQAENDSLKLASLKQGGAYDEMLALLDEVEQNFKKIKEAENYLTEQSQVGGELSQSVKDRINNDMLLLTETLKKNKEQIVKLEQQLKSSGLKNSGLEKRLAAMAAEIEEKTKSIATLQEELEKKNIIIGVQGQRIAQQQSSIQQQNQSIEQQHETIVTQDKSMNTAYFAFGTKKELEKHKILTKGKLMQQGYNQEYFSKIDIRELRQIPFYTKKVKVLSTHPASSYALEKGSDGSLTLVILDKQEFWSISKYMVAQVD